jgi:hypothetical protein
VKLPDWVRLPDWVGLPDRDTALRALAVAALVVAASSKGDAIVLGLVLVLMELRPATLVAVAAALGASSWRWGSTSLDALAGAQSVLGPAARVGPTAAAAGSCLAALALLLTLARGTEPVRLLAIGATVAAVLAGPGPGGQIVLRVGVALVVAGLALVLGRLVESRRGVGRVAEAAAVLAGAGAFVAVAPNAPVWPPDVDLGLVTTGVAVAAATFTATVIWSAAAGGARWSGGWVPPRLRRPEARHSAVPSRPR